MPFPVTIVVPPDGATASQPFDAYGTYTKPAGSTVTGVTVQIDGGALVPCPFHDQGGGWGPFPISGLAPGAHRLAVFVGTNNPPDVGQAYASFSV